MKWKVHEVAEIFSVREFTRLCGLVDKEWGNASKFDIVGIGNGEDGRLVITVVLDGGKTSLINFGGGDGYGRNLRAKITANLPATGGQGKADGG